MRWLVPDWRSAWRWWSVRIAALLAILPLVWVEIPPDLKAMVPPHWRPWIFSAMALAMIAGRLKDQSK